MDLSSGIVRDQGGAPAARFHRGGGYDIVRDVKPGDRIGTYILDALVGVHHTPPTPPETPDGPQIVLEGLYWVKAGDNAWNTEKTVYGGTGSKWKDHFTADQFLKVDYHIPLPDLPGVTAKILPGEGPYAAIKRMYPAENPYAPGRLERFYALNGGSGRTLQPGDVVFLDEPA